MVYKGKKMKLKNSIELVVEREDKQILLVCQNDTPLGFLFDALSEMKDYVKKRIEESEKVEEQEKVDAE